jgi:hypothetical protein
MVATLPVAPRRMKYSPAGRRACGTSWGSPAGTRARRCPSRRRRVLHLEVHRGVGGGLGGDGHVAGLGEPQAQHHVALEHGVAERSAAGSRRRCPPRPTVKRPPAETSSASSQRSCGGRRQPPGSAHVDHRRCSCCRCRRRRSRAARIHPRVGVVAVAAAPAGRLDAGVGLGDARVAAGRAAAADVGVAVAVEVARACAGRSWSPRRSGRWCRCSCRCRRWAYPRMHPRRTSHCLDAVAVHHVVAGRGVGHVDAAAVVGADVLVQSTPSSHWALRVHTRPRASGPPLSCIGRSASKMAVSPASMPASATNTGGFVAAAAGHAGRRTEEGHGQRQAGEGSRGTGVSHAGASGGQRYAPREWSIGPTPRPARRPACAKARGSVIAALEPQGDGA